MGGSFQNYTLPVLLVGALMLLLSSCRSIRPIQDEELENYEPIEIAPHKIISQIPRSEHTLQSVKGKGKALVSTPEGSDRVTLYFSGNRDTSLITIRNRIGIEGGELLVTGDSILVYDKIDQRAHKLSFEEAHATQINSLASANLVDILDYKLSADEVENVFANSQYYLLMLVDKTQIRLDRKNFHIKEVQLPAGRKAPYNRIQYEGYSNVQDFHLPRKITVTSTDQSSQVTLLIQSLTINPSRLELTVDIPDQILIQRL